MIEYYLCASAEYCWNDAARQIVMVLLTFVSLIRFEDLNALGVVTQSRSLNSKIAVLYLMLYEEEMKWHKEVLVSFLTKIRVVYLVWNGFQTWGTG